MGDAAPATPEIKLRQRNGALYVNRVDADVVFLGPQPRLQSGNSCLRQPVGWRGRGHPCRVLPPVRPQCLRVSILTPIVDKHTRSSLHTRWSSFPGRGLCSTRLCLRPTFRWMSGNVDTLRPYESKKHWALTPARMANQCSLGRELGSVLTTNNLGFPSTKNVSLGQTIGTSLAECASPSSASVSSVVSIFTRRFRRKWMFASWRWFRQCRP